MIKKKKKKKKIHFSVKCSLSVVWSNTSCRSQKLNNIH